MELGWWVSLDLLDKVSGMMGLDGYALNPAISTLFSLAGVERAVTEITVMFCKPGVRQRGLWQPAHGQGASATWIPGKQGAEERLMQENGIKATTEKTDSTKPACWKTKN